jgi:hypothetical protein
MRTPPSLYHEWAARSRGVSERWVLQQAVEASCASLSEPYFEVTPTQVMAFKKLIIGTFTVQYYPWGWDLATSENNASGRSGPCQRI